MRKTNLNGHSAPGVYSKESSVPYGILKPSWELYGRGSKSSKAKVVDGSDYYSKLYLSFEILSAGTVVWTYYGEDNTNVKTIYYSINKGEWIDMTPTVQYDEEDEQFIGTTVIELSVGDTIRFKGDNNAYEDMDGNFGNSFSEDGSAVFNIYGNIMSLIDSVDFVSASTVYDASFMNLFSGTKVVNASNLILPATELEVSCYSYMFYGCASLVQSFRQ